jgi:hypothetical protein
MAERERAPAESSPEFFLDRITHLTGLSGLRVTVRKERGHNVFEFLRGGECVKTCFTYAKARLFAEGIQWGRAAGPLPTRTEPQPKGDCGQETL